LIKQATLSDRDSIHRLRHLVVGAKMGKILRMHLDHGRVLY
jgi:hypothetical protein